MLRRSGRVAAVALVLAVGGCATAQGGGEPTASAGDAAALGTATSSVAKVLGLPLAVQDLTVSPDGRTVWFASCGDSGQNLLWSVDITDRAAHSHSLPDGECTGFTMHTRISSDGAVWVNCAYDLIRFDPATDKAATLTFTPAVDDAVPGSLDPSDTLPGTWLSSIVADGDDALVARNHVPYLTRVDPNLHAARDVAVDADHAGAADMVRGADGTIVLLAAYGSSAPAITLNGATVKGTVGTGSQRLILDGPTLSALSPDRTTVTVLDSDRLPVGSTTSWTRTGTDGTSATYDASAGQFVRRAADGAKSSLRLDRIDGAVSGGGLTSGGDRVTGPDAVTTIERITDFFVATDGAVWMLRANGTELARWAP